MDKHMKKLIIGTLSIGVLLFAADDQATTVEHTFTATNAQTLDFQFSNYTIEAFTHNDEEFHRIQAGAVGTISEVGEPNLPAMSTFMMMDPSKTYDVNITIHEVETQYDINMVPAQSWDDPEITPGMTLTRLDDVYNSQDVYPQSPVTLSEPLTMRDIHVQQVIITPFQYTPSTGELSIIKSATIDIIETGSSSIERFTPQRVAKEFEPMYRGLVSNYDQVMGAEIEYQKPAILYIYPSSGSGVSTNLEPLIEWRKRAGYDVTVVSTSTTGSSSSEIKSYIETAYTTWDNPPVWVSLVGDASGSYSIPTFYESWSWYNGEGDQPYAELVGGDILPEVFVGRISISSSTDLINIVNKTVQYETNPFMGENWFTRAVLVGDPGSSGVSTVITNRSIAQLLEYHGYDDIREVYSSPFPSQMTSNLSDGATFFNYRGYYGVSGYDCGDVGNANNGFKLPIATVITCGTGSFGSGTSIAECMLRAGTVSNPEGSVGSIGTATTGTHTMFNNIVDLGFYYGVFGEGMMSPAGALARGKIHLLQAYPTNPSNYVSIFTHWNSLMGDPAVRMWTKVPEYIVVGFLPIVSKGTNYIDIQVNYTNGTPVSDAYVTLYKGDVNYSVSLYTDANGHVTLPIDQALIGEIKVTAIKDNHIPYQGSLMVTEPPVSVNLMEDMIDIIDDGTGVSVGNSDGILNPGEIAEISVPFYNFGSDTSTAIYAKLVSESSNVTIIQDSVYIGVINSGESVLPVDHFAIQVHQGLVDDTNLDIRMDIVDADGSVWHGYVGGLINGTNINAREVFVQDYGDHILQSGETSEIEIILKNEGSIMADNVVGEITCPHPDIDIIDAYGSWGDVYPEQLSSNSSDQFTVYAGESIIPGTIVHLSLSLTAEGNVQYSQIVPLQIGDPQVSDPVGPDAHGYYIYDSGDLLYGMAPYYNWVEIDDRNGGDGSYLSTLQDYGNNGDESVTVNLPFTFRMYGTDYDQISICSNGWISMGSTQIASFRNYHLPGPGGPSPMIAAFWDDLTITSGGRVYTKDDQDSHTFIVQWSNVRTYQNNSAETFQVILRDPQYYFTPTGDGEILIQYKDFNNTSYTTGSAQQHGNYCTVGIEDRSATVGLEYTHNNSYAPAAMPLSDETAILITTRGSTIRMRGDVTQDNLINIYDILLLVDFILADEVAELNPYLADINGDGNVNVLDVIGMVQTVMNY